MKNTNKFFSRRNFIKGVAINAAALSAIPIGVLGNDSTSPGSLNKAKATRLPLRIMMKSVTTRKNTSQIKIYLPNCSGD